MRNLLEQPDDAWMQRLKKIEEPFNPHGAAPVTSQLPGFNPYLRCPLPLSFSSSDNLRQFYRQGAVQNRIIQPNSVP